MIIRNAVRCRYCGTEVESVSSFRFVSCRCHRCTIGGGYRRLLRDPYTLLWAEELSIEKEDVEGHRNIEANWNGPAEHTLINVEPLSDFRLFAVFTCGRIVVYDVKPLGDSHKEFYELVHEPEYFRRAALVPHGYGVHWNSHLDLSADEIWRGGTDADHMRRRIIG